jgi:hypothetical protein
LASHHPAKTGRKIFSAREISDVSATLMRTWYDEDDPGVKFVTDGERLGKVPIKGDNGKTYGPLYRDREYRRFEEVVKEKSED